MYCIYIICIYISMEEECGPKKYIECSVPNKLGRVQYICSILIQHDGFMATGPPEHAVYECAQVYQLS